MSNSSLAEDIYLYEKLGAKDNKLIIYSAREASNPSEEKNYGYESRKFYKNLQVVYYNFPSKYKLVRSFEQVWQVTNNITDKGFISKINGTKWTQMIEDIL